MKPLFYALFFVFFILSCNDSSFKSDKGKGSEPEPEPTSTISLSVSPSSAKVLLSESLTFKATEKSNNENVTSDVEWSSSDTNILKLTNKAKGKFRGKSAGNAVVTASLDGVTASANVEVYCINSDILEQGTTTKYSKLTIGVENCIHASEGPGGDGCDDAYVLIQSNDATPLDITYGKSDTKSYLFSNKNQTLKITSNYGYINGDKAEWGSTSAIYPDSSYTEVIIANCQGKEDTYHIPYNGTTKEIPVAKGDRIHISSHFEGPAITSGICPVSDTYFTDDFTLGYAIYGDPHSTVIP